MQLPTDPPRSAFRREDVIELLTGNGTRDIKPGLEIVSRTGQFVRDITPLLKSGSVSRENLAEGSHGKLDIEIAASLPWGNTYVRPYQIWTNRKIAARFNLGEYVLTSPDRDSSTQVRQVTGYDRIHVLSVAIGDTLVLPGSLTYRQAIEQVIISSGETRYRLDSTASSGQLLGADKVFSLIQTETGSDNKADRSTLNTYQRVINELALGSGYNSVWYDQDGFLRVTAARPDSQRAAEWEFSTGSKGTRALVQDSSESNDTWSVHNVWKFRNSDSETADEGNGVYTFTNWDDGDTSVNQLGYKKTKLVEVKMADQNALVAYAQQQIASDRAIARTFEVTTAPIPLFGHQDMYKFADSRLGFNGKVIARSLEYPLFGSQMSHTWEESK